MTRAEHRHLTAIADAHGGHLLASLRTIQQQRDIIAAATIYSARCGRKRGFLSLSDAMAYERGWGDAAEGSDPTLESGPYMDGYLDREHWDDERDEARADAAAAEGEL